MEFYNTIERENDVLIYFVGDDGNHYAFSVSSSFTTQQEREQEATRQYTDISSQSNTVSYSLERKSAILNQWPVYNQLEAITENFMGRPKKLQSLLSDIISIKALYPK